MVLTGINRSRIRSKGDLDGVPTPRCDNNLLMGIIVRRWLFKYLAWSNEFFSACIQLTGLILNLKHIGPSHARWKMTVWPVPSHHLATELVLLVRQLFCKSLDHTHTEPLVPKVHLLRVQRVKMKHGVPVLPVHTFFSFLSLLLLERYLQLVSHKTGCLCQ